MRKLTQDWVKIMKVKLFLKKLLRVVSQSVAKLVLRFLFKINEEPVEPLIHHWDSCNMQNLQIYNYIRKRSKVSKFVGVIRSSLFPQVFHSWLNRKKNRRQREEA